MEGFDVIIVGAGLAGSALAATLTPAGMSVLLLERQVEYRDRVRGEYMGPWGVAEVLKLGLDDALLGAGGAFSARHVMYDERTDPARSEAEFATNPMTLAAFAGVFAGPELQPAEAFAPENVERILRLA